MKNIEALRRLGEIVSFQQDEIIFFQGETGNAVYLLLKGKVAVILCSLLDGNETVVTEIGEGDIIGEMALLSNGKRSATIKALTDVIALKIMDSHFEDLVKLHPGYAKGLLISLSKRIVVTRARVDEAQMRHIKV